MLLAGFGLWAGLTNMQSMQFIDRTNQGRGDQTNQPTWICSPAEPSTLVMLSGKLKAIYVAAKAMFSWTDKLTNKYLGSRYYE